MKKPFPLFSLILALALCLSLGRPAGTMAQDQAESVQTGSIQAGSAQTGSGQVVSDQAGGAKYRGLGYSPVAPVVSVTLEKEVERPRAMFTQGLIFYNQRLYESTGLYKQSALHTYPVTELEQKGGLGTEAQLNLPPEVFAEGLAEANGELYLLTWNEGIVYVIEPSNLEVKNTIHQAMEGWGLAYDGRTFWRSDGSDRLQKHQAGDFAPTGDPLLVKDGQNPVRRLNELEWDQRSGLILANIWHTDLIAAIDPATGSVRYYLDLTPLAEKERQKSGGQNAEAVANGLAIDGQGRLWVTGKLWPSLYHISYRAP